MPATHPIQRKVESAVRRALVGPCRVTATRDEMPGTLVVAVSGGPDSLALLYAVHRVTRQAKRAPQIVVAHFDHGLRGEAVGNTEAVQVEEHAGRLGIPFAMGVAQWASTPRSEDAARRLRYRFLGDVAQSYPVAVVATGHTLTDQAETVLLHLVRGAGLRGLAGMTWRASFPLGGSGPEIVRPLLGLARADTVTYCTALDLRPTDDPSNTDRRFARNRLRLDVLPILRAINPSVEQAIARGAETARHADELISTMATEAETALVEQVGPRVAVDTNGVSELPTIVRQTLVRRLLERAGMSDAGVDARAIHAVERLAGAADGASVNLPGGQIALVDERRLVVGQQPLTSKPHEAETDLAISATGEYMWRGWQVSVVSEPAPHIEQPAPRWSAWLQASLLGQRLSIGARRPGERIAQLGLTGTRKVQDVLVDARIPAADRDQVPIVRVDRKVAWVAGVRLAGWAVAGPEEHAIRITFARHRP